MNKIFKDKNISVGKVIFTLVVSALFIIYFPLIIEFLKSVLSILSPLITGAIIAYVLNILVVKYEKIYFPNSKNKILKKSTRYVSILMSIITVGLLIALVISLVVPQFIDSIEIIIKQFPVLIENITKWIQSNLDMFPELKDKINLNNIDGFGIFEKIAGSVLSWAGSGFSFIGTVAGSVVNFVISFIFAIYILSGKERLQRQFKKLFNAVLKPEKLEKFYKILKVTNRNFSNYIIGQCVEAIILGTLCTLGMFIFKFPNAAMIGSLIGITALIPMIGAYIGAGLGAFMILMVDPMKALLFLIFIVLLQQFEGNVIYPKVVGGKVGLPGIWVLAAVIAGGGLFGVVGILFGVPATAVVYQLTREYIGEKQKLKEKNGFQGVL